MNIADLKVIEGYAAMLGGLFVLLGFLWKKGLLTFTPDKGKGTETPVSKIDFKEAMDALNTRLIKVEEKALAAHISAHSAATSLQQIAAMLESSMRHLGDRFDNAIDRLDTAVAKVVDRLHDHETRISRNEAAFEQRGRTIDYLMDRTQKSDTGR